MVRKKHPDCDRLALKLSEASTSTLSKYLASYYVTSLMITHEKPFVACVKKKKQTQRPLCSQNVQTGYNSTHSEKKLYLFNKLCKIPIFSFTIIPSSLVGHFGHSKLATCLNKFGHALCRLRTLVEHHFSLEKCKLLTLIIRIQCYEAYWIE